MKLLTLSILLFYYNSYNVKSVSADSRIYGGYPINITDAPYMVHITIIKEIFPNGSGLRTGCGGTILRKNLILTAGHCVQNVDDGTTFDAQRLIVQVGSNLKHGGTRHDVSNVYPHPKFQAGRNRKHHDIGLLELTKEIELGQTSQYTKLVHKNDKIHVGADGIVNGWGKNPDIPHDDRLNQVHLNVISSEECARLNNEDDAEGYEKHEICTIGANGKNFCVGDSGGPFIDTRTGRQIGVASYRNQDCTLPLPNIFSKIQDNLDFINHVIMKTRRSRR